MRECALLIVDVQNDFCPPDGSLAVPDGDRVVQPLDAVAALFRAHGLDIYASRDWHPPGTVHFQKWPVHCVAGTRGAEFHPGLNLRGAVIISKGMGADEDAYSAFLGVNEDGRPFADVLRARGIRKLYIGGLATDYCVRATVLGARADGFLVSVMMDACRAVDSGAGVVALNEMEAQGAEKIWSTQAIRELFGDTATTRLLRF